MFGIATRAFRVSWGLLAVLLSLFCLPPCYGQRQMTAEQMQQLLNTPLPEDPAALLAIVGNDPILVGDIMPRVNNFIKQQTKGDVSNIPANELHAARVMLTRQLLKERITTKMVGNAFMINKVGSASAEQRREAQGQIELQLRKSFHNDQIPRLKEALEVETDEQLAQKLIENGTTLKQMEADHMDTMLRMAYVHEMIEDDPPVSLNEIRQYYNSHRKEYESQAAARWEQLTVRFDKFPSREAALREIEDMFNEARFGGNVQSVAKARSQEPLATNGGLHEWTNKGSLKSKPLDHNIFTLPLNRLSSVIEDEDGLHVVRVLERRPAGLRPLSAVQDEIRDAIKEEKKAKATEDLMVDIRKQVPVWTLYPDDVPGAKPLHQVSLKK